MKTSLTLITTSCALFASLGLMACGGSEIEPADQSKSASLTQQQSQPAPAGAAAPAPMGRDGRRGDHRMGPPSPDKMIARFDTNKDGVLQASELPERMQEHIGEIDTSGDGVVTKDELVAHFKAKFAERAKERFDKHDTNHDGLLEQNEVPPEHWARLVVADANGDGKLSPDELRAAFESGKLKPPMRGERGEHGRWEHDHDGPPPASTPPASTPPAGAAPPVAPVL